MNAPTRLFLVITDRQTGESTVRDVGVELEAAMRLLKETERHSTADVVLLGSESLETLKRTHSSYFGTEDAVGRALSGISGG